MGRNIYRSVGMTATAIVGPQSLGKDRRLVELNIDREIARLTPADARRLVGALGCWLDGLDEDDQGKLEASAYTPEVHWLSCESGMLVRATSGEALANLCESGDEKANAE